MQSASGAMDGVAPHVYAWMRTHAERMQLQRLMQVAVNCNQNNGDGMTVFEAPEYIKQILSRLTENGHAAYLVGGCVRDALMRRTVHDWDIATSAPPVETARIFDKTVLTGERFGTVTVVLPEGMAEVTTFRSEGEYHDGRRPQNVEFVATVDVDLSRRDFTMNAMAISADGGLIDPFNGLDDINNKIVRCVGDPDARFNEDALRMFRAHRFSAELGFAIESETLNAIRRSSGKAALISAERVRVELEKTLMSQKPEAAGEMIRSGLLNRYLENKSKSPAGFERISMLPEEPTLRWSAFCSMLLDARLIKSVTGFLKELRLDKKTVKVCSAAMTIQCFPGDKTDIKRLLAKHGIDAVRCAAVACDVKSVERRASGSPTLERTDEVINSGECFSLCDMAVSGSDLFSQGYFPGRELGETLGKLLDHVVEHPEDNTREILLDIALNQIMPQTISSKLCDPVKK